MNGLVDFQAVTYLLLSIKMCTGKYTDNAKYVKTYNCFHHIGFIQSKDSTNRSNSMFEYRKYCLNLHRECLYGIRLGYTNILKG